MSLYCVGHGQDINRELPIAEFIRRWSNLDGGQERANYSLFLTELCDVIGVKRPDPALAAHDFNDYVFERRVERKRPDGTTEAGRIDLYKRGCFILEAKQSRLRGGGAGGPGELHDRLDAAVVKSYGWCTDIDTEQILDGLVRLNEVRVAEERRGFIKWLRPEYQIDKIGPLAHRGDRVQAILATKVKAKKVPFPAARLDQARIVLDLMMRAKAPLSAEEIAVTFTSPDKTVAEIRDVLRSLLRLGQAESCDEGRSFFRAA